MSTTLSSQGVEYSSSLQLQAQLGGPEPYTADGLPILPQGNEGISEGTTSFDTVGLNPQDGEAAFEITSLAPVPLPASIWLMLAALDLYDRHSVLQQLLAYAAVLVSSAVLGRATPATRRHSLKDS